MKILKNKEKIGLETHNLPIYLAIFITTSALVYYFYALNWLGLILSIILFIISIIILKKLNLTPGNPLIINASHVNEQSKSKKLTTRIVIVSYLVFLGAAVLELISAQSGRPLISPWEVVSKFFFFFYLLASLLLIVIISKSDIKRQAKLILISLYYFIGLLVAVIVYRIGYGFDPFIHQAAMEIIAKQGFILPKTPYYLGQYGLIVSLHKILGLSISFLNTILVPILAACLLPTSIFRFISQIKKKTSPEKELSEKAEENTNLLTTLILLTFSWPLFIITTPQNLSYIFIILSVLAGLSEKGPWRATIFAISAASIHPITGIPALIWGAWLILRNRLGKIGSAIILSAGALVLPLALFIGSGAKIINLNFSWKNIYLPLEKVWQLASTGQEDLILNLVYFLERNQIALLIILISTGAGAFYYHYRHLLKDQLVHAWQGLTTISASLFIAFLISTQISFAQLIAYEQGDYASRILTIIIIFLSPFVGLTVKRLISSTYKQESASRFIWLAIGAIFITISLYLAYPRFDKYFNARGYSTSDFDLTAVKLADSLASDKYIVLANQQVSAAALDTFGFDNYLTTPVGQIFFYPIPTGGPLYKYYLEMVYEDPSRQVMLSAMDLGSVNEGFLIINKYWKDSGKIIKAAKLSANRWEKIGQEEIFIFHYQR